MYIQLNHRHVILTYNQFVYVSFHSYAYLYATLCFFGGILITAIFDVCLHLFEKWIGARKAKKEAILPNANYPSLDQQPSTNNELDTRSQNDQDEPLELDHEVAHDGEMVANMYANHSHDAKALIRMGIFAGIALGFHVRNHLHNYSTDFIITYIYQNGLYLTFRFSIYNIFHNEFTTELPRGTCHFCSGA